MTQEHPENIMDSWGLQSNFATGPVVKNNLVPPPYGRTGTNFITRWREEVMDSRFDWDVRNFTVLLPESLRVLSSIYIKVDLPQLASDKYKPYPALHILKRLTILSGGQEIYSCDVGVLLGDYCQSLSEEQLKIFGRTYLGNQATMDGAARTVMVPVLLPNSTYLGRNGHDTQGHGVFPAYLGNTRLEFQFTTNEAKYLANDASVPPGSIAGACTLMYHEVILTSFNTKQFQDKRGNYSIINRRFTELTSGWTRYASANTVETVRHSQPQGTVSEIQIIAVADEDDESRHKFDYILPTSIKCTADARVQRDLNSKQKCEIENWQNGFVPPDDFPSPGRMCFANHAGEVSHMYSGGYNMTLASNVDFAFTFAEAVRYRIFAVQYQRIKIDAVGKISSYLT